MSKGDRVVKIGVIACELVGVVIAVATAGAALLYWRLQWGPVSLSVFDASVERALQRTLPEGDAVSVKSVSLAKAGAPGEYNLSIRNIAIVDRQDAPIANLSGAELQFLLRDVLHGVFAPSRILIDDAAVTFGNRTVETRSGANATSRIFQPMLGALNSKRSISALRNTELRITRISFSDAASGRSWLAHGASVKSVKTAAGFKASAEGLFDIDGRTASLRVNADYVRKTGIVSAGVHVVEAPLGDILEMFFGRRAAMITAPVSGQVSLRLSQSGSILSSRIDSHLGAGEIRLGGRSVDIDAIDLHAAYDPAENAFVVDELEFAAGGSRGAVQGSLGVDLKHGSGALEQIRFDLRSNDLLLDIKDFFSEPLTIDEARISGVYAVASRRISAEHIAARMLGVGISGVMSYAPAQRGNIAVSPEVEGRLAVSGALDPQSVLRAWPINVGAGAREFVAERLPSARVDNVVFNIDLPAGALTPGEPTPDDAWSVTFDVSNARAFYSPEMTPLSAASGAGRLTGNRFVINAVKGRIGAVAISDGEIEFTALSPAGEPVYYRFTASGQAQDILGIMNEEPLALLKHSALTPSRFVGKAVVHAKITRPNRAEVPRASYRYEGKATFTDLTLTDFLGGGELTRANGNVDFGSRSLTVNAGAVLGDSPIKIHWINNFYEEDGPSRFHITGELDSSTGDVFGVPTRQILRGPVKFSADAVGDLGGIDTLKVDADFTAADLTFDAFGWRKQSEIPAKGSLDLALRDDGVEVRNAEFSGDALAIEGKGLFGKDGVIEQFDFSRFYLGGAADFVASAKRTQSGLLDVTLTGPLLNAAQLIRSAVEDGGRGKNEEAPEWGAGIILRGRFDELRARGGSVYRDATLDFRRGAENIEGLDFSARTSEGKPLSIVLKETGAVSGPGEVVEARTDDIGALLSGVFSISSVKGGEGYMELRPVRGGDMPGGLAGVLEARNMRVVGAPLLARIFAAGSLDGLADLLNGEGIALDRAYAKFGYKGGVLNIDEARATGPSVGITSAGSITAGDDGAVALNGAVAPAYLVNSLPGKAPIIGDIFVNREGEGVVALSYTVAGPSGAPTVTVNPLSALAPGFLRRMFEGRAPAAAQEAPNDAGSPAVEEDSPKSQ